MGEKTISTIYVDEDVLKTAKEMGLNISKTCENALKLAIEQLKPIYGNNNPQNLLKNTPNDHMVGPGRFERPSRESESRSLDQTSRRSHVC